MTEAITANFQAFEPFNGGAGARLLAGSTTQNVAIPGLAGGDSNENRRVVVTNPNAFSIFIRIGDATVTATLSSFEIIAGSSQVLRPPSFGPGALYMAAITAAGDSGYISICSGTGT